MCSLLFTALGLSMVTVPPPEGDPWFGTVLLVASVAMGIRGFMHATVIVRPSEVKLRAFLSTRHVPLAGIVSAEVRVGRTGPNGFGRQYLVLRRGDGEEIAFRELNARPSRSGAGPTCVERAVAAINGLVDGRG